MKYRILFVTALLGVCGFTACSTTSPATTTVNDKTALAIETITAARRESTAALTAGKITVAQDKAAQANFDIARAALQAAQGALAASAPASGVTK